MKKHKTAGVLLLALLITLFGGCSKEKAENSTTPMKAGVYTQEVKGAHGTIVLDVELSRQSIRKISVTSNGDTPGISDKAIEAMPKRIVEAQKLDVDTVSGATMTSEAVVKAVAAAIKEAGGLASEFYSADAVSSASDKNSWALAAVPEQWDRSCDIAVVGAGGAGLAASLQAAEQGAEVLLFEKMPATGGTSQFAEGVFGMNSSVQAAQGINFDEDHLFYLAMEFTHWRANGRILRSFMNKSGESIDWLLDKGLKVKYVQSLVPGEPPTWHVFEGRGAALCKTLTGAIEAKDNAEILTSTPVRRLVKENGRIIGLEAEGVDGKSLFVEADAVIITTGGFANNREMMKRYVDSGEELVPAGNISKTGDGINMALAAGADTDGISTVQVFGPLAKGMGFSAPSGLMARQPTSIWLASDGRRFCDEGIAWNFPYSGNAQARLKDNIAYAVFDEKAVQHMINKGVVMGAGDFVPVGTKLLPLPADMKKAKEAGVLFEADSPEELAAKLGLDPQALSKSIETYNSFCEQGRDEVFAKSPEYLWPIGNGSKLYGVICENDFIGTIGGLRINEKMQVLNTQHQVIPGLYAGGSCAGGLYGDTYNLITCGGTFGFAVNSGRIAAEQALSR